MKGRFGKGCARIMKAIVLLLCHAIHALTSIHPFGLR
jgi:hypothetical protein